MMREIIIFFKDYLGVENGEERRRKEISPFLFFLIYSKMEEILSLIYFKERICIRKEIFQSLAAKFILFLFEKIQNFNSSFFF